MHILIVEDTTKLAENLATVLRSLEYTVSLAVTAQEAETQVAENTFDLIILDLALPDGDGVELCKQWRSEKITTPILMLTAKITLESKISGLDTGADDYLTKPFQVEELLARVKALLRRTNQNATSAVLSTTNLELNTTTKKVLYKESEVDISPTEYRILEFLLYNKAVPQTTLRIHEAVWGAESENLIFSDTLKVHIARLRKKLDSDLITTIPGIGYVIN